MLTSQQKVFRKFWHATVPLSSLQGETPATLQAAGPGHRAVPRRAGPARRAAGPLLPPHRQAQQGPLRRRQAAMRLPRLDLRRQRQGGAHPAVRRGPQRSRPSTARRPTAARRSTATPGWRWKSRSHRFPTCPSSTHRAGAPSSSSTSAGPPARCVRWRTASTTATSASCTAPPSAWPTSPSPAATNWSRTTPASMPRR